MYPSGPNATLRRFFSGLTEQTFEARLGVADPPLIDYIAELLTRFVRCDSIFRVRDLAGRRLDQVADLLLEGEARIGDARRQVHRHIGDYALFWTGVYPEAVEHLRRSDRKDHLVNYTSQGKRSYYIASTIESPDGDDENVILGRLSHEFELCAYGLGEVRREWERREPAGGGWELGSE